MLLLKKLGGERIKMKHAIAAMIIAGILSISPTLMAAQISLDPSYIEVVPGEEFTVNITVYPEGNETYGAQ